jgi:two-component system KDP operon response regulator KdpE
MSDLKILNVDDEPQARRAVKIALVARGFEVCEAASGEDAIGKLREENPDVVLLDVNMPGMNGLETCRAIRACSDVPVIVISVRKAGKERAEAFEAGADQYVTKPFDVEELIARIRAVKRRSGAFHSHAIALGDIEIDLESHEVKRQGNTIHLTAKEFKLLHYLVEHAGAVISHRRLLQAVWGPDYGDEVEYLRVFINQVRKKIEPDPRNPRYLLTEPSMGYRFVIGTAASGKS